MSSSFSLKYLLICFTLLLYIQVPLGGVTPFAVISKCTGTILQNTMSPPPQHQQMENLNVQVLQEPLMAHPRKVTDGSSTFGSCTVVNSLLAIHSVPLIYPNLLSFLIFYVLYISSNTIYKYVVYKKAWIFMVHISP